MFIPRAIVKVSATVVAVEKLVLGLLVAGIAGFVLANVLLRLAGITLAWADELAIHFMILSGFVGASLMLRARTDPAVFLLHELLPTKAVGVLKVIISFISLAFGITLFYLCWRWFNPLGLLAVNLDVADFEATTFNFIYTDVTPVMGLSSYWFYLIIPWFAITITIHAAANLMEDFGFVERGADPVGVRLSEH
ncbi:TRAP transporter small permease subunit [uncultured Aliiroseovarius sp.]|uniref:TRAP transporter small permease n=1 Tax=uncultured Aliiroseovarius sp. TaxID=1658783 RepID=UPI00259133D7|nr:TRAP transporter small permease subunit [uncultured Aliiroseovarius sp.]